jgi:hypothetical protein
MSKNTYKYLVNGHDYEIETVWDDDDGAEIAEEAADNYQSMHDGWEKHWPLEFEIRALDDRVIGNFTVEREFEPVFSAYPK